MTVTNEDVTPRLFDHAKQVYEEMEKRSRKEADSGTIEEGVVPAAMLDVYEGHTTRLFSDLGIANPYYTKIMEALKAQGCIDQIRRGGGSATSKWVLNYPPEEEGFRAIMERKRAPKGKGAILEQRVRDLTVQVNSLEERVETLMEAFMDFRKKVEEVGK